MQLRKPHRPGREKISDPAAHAERYGTGPFLTTEERDLWGGYARHYTTTAQFGTVDGVRWYNNCGPTAVTNLLSMVRRQSLRPEAGPKEDAALYGRVARFGVRRLYYFNLNGKLIHGTSDLRAGRYISRTAFRALGVRPEIRFLPVTEQNLRRSLDRGGLLYLLLRNHPEYRDHHVVGYGYVVLKSQTTGETRFYLKISDGHAAAPRYLDLADLTGRLRFYYEVRFPAGEP